MVSSTLKISEKRPLQYPKSVGFIISNEFCERFNYYGMRTILVLYLTRKLHYDDDTSTVLFHVFTMLVYLCPLLGAIIADSWLGKFKTIFYLSVVYSIGGIIVALGAVPVFHLPVKEVTIIGLILIAIGTGGIKPCVSAFGGDQFKLPEQAKQLATFFSLFYFAINAGSMVSTSLTPILREDIHCFGDKDCFSLAFGVPALLMLLSVFIFVAGKHLYVLKAPAGNMIFGVAKCIADALTNWRIERKAKPRKHWLDYAEPTVGPQLVSDTKRLLKILVLYLPFPVFWALFDQQGSRWTFQATRMNGELWGYNIKPDQMQVINPLLILGFIPLFDYGLYPLLAKIGLKRPLQKLTLGGLLAAAAFALSASVELKLEALQPKLPGPLHAQIRIYNGNPCAYSFKTDLPFKHYNSHNNIRPLGLWEQKYVAAMKDAAFIFEAEPNDPACPLIVSTLHAPPAKCTSYFINNDRLIEFTDAPQKPKQGDPIVRVMINTPSAESGGIVLRDPADVETKLQSGNATQAVTVLRGDSVLFIDGLPITNITTKVGGVYALIVQGNKSMGYSSIMHTVTAPNSVHMLWQLPQILVITAAEIMFSVTGLEFSFTQAPQSMKSVLQACWLLSVAIGNMLVVVIAELKFFHSQAAEFALFSGLMFVDMFIFMLLAMRYKYVEQVAYDADAKGPTTITSATSRSDKSAKKQQKSVSNGVRNDAYVDVD